MAGLEPVLATSPRSGSPSPHRKLVELDEKSGNLQSSRRNYWALTICAHCRDYTSSTCVFACYGKLAHHREVVLVDGHGARESVGVLCDGQDGVPSPAEGALGTIEDLDLKYVADRRVRCMVSCELCAGLPLGGCIDRGHQQQERFSDALPAKSTRRLPTALPCRTPLSKHPAGVCGKPGDSESRGKVSEGKGRGGARVKGGGKWRREEGEGGVEGGGEEENGAVWRGEGAKGGEKTGKRGREGGVKGGTGVKGAGSGGGRKGRREDGGGGRNGVGEARDEGGRGGGGGGGSAAGALAAAAASATTGRQCKRKSVFFDGANHDMPTFIYARDGQLKVELRWGKGRFLVNGEPCADGTFNFGPMPNGMSLENLVKRVALRDTIWWEETRTIHKLLAAKILFRYPVAKVAAYKEDEPIVIALREGGSGNGVGAVAAASPLPFSSTKRELREIDGARPELLKELFASAGAAYAKLVEQAGAGEADTSSSGRGEGEAGGEGENPPLARTAATEATRSPARAAAGGTGAAAKTSAKAAKTATKKAAAEAAKEAEAKAAAKAAETSAKTAKKAAKKTAAEAAKKTEAQAVAKADAKAAKKSAAEAEAKAAKKAAKNAKKSAAETAAGGKGAAKAGTSTAVAKSAKVEAKAAKAAAKEAAATTASSSGSTSANVAKKVSVTTARPSPPANAPEETDDSSPSGGDGGSITLKISRSGKKRKRLKSGSDRGGGGDDEGDSPEPDSTAGARARGGGGDVGGGGSKDGGKDGERSSSRKKKKESSRKGDKKAGRPEGAATAATAEAAAGVAAGATTSTVTGVARKRSRREDRAAASAVAAVAAAVAEAEAEAAAVAEKELVRSSARPASRVDDAGVAVVVSSTAGERGPKTAAVVEDCGGVDGAAVEGIGGATSKGKLPPQPKKQQQHQLLPELVTIGRSSSKPLRLVEVPTEAADSDTARCTPSPPPSSSSSPSLSPSSPSSSSSIGADADAGGGRRRRRAAQDDGCPSADVTAAAAVASVSTSPVTSVSAAPVASVSTAAVASISAAAMASVLTTPVMASASTTPVMASASTAPVMALASTAPVASASIAPVTSVSTAPIASVSTAPVASTAAALASAAKTTRPNGKRKPLSRDDGADGSIISAVGSNKKPRTVDSHGGGVPEVNVEMGETILPRVPTAPVAATAAVAAAAATVVAGAKGEPPGQLGSIQVDVCESAGSDGVSISASCATTGGDGGGAAAAIAEDKSEPGTERRLGVGKAAAQAGMRVATASSSVEHARDIELARFAECQRRELEEAKRRCREELAPLEAEIEALKQKLRKRMKGVMDRHAMNRAAFTASLYGADPEAPS